MRVIRKLSENGEDQMKRKLPAVVIRKSFVRYWMIAPFKKKSWMKLMIHWELYDQVVDESTSTDDEDYHNQENEVHEEEYVQQKKISHICQNGKK